MRVEKTKYEEKIKLKKGDEVVVLVGDQRGTRGKIERVDYKNSRVFVDGVNIAKRHTRPSIQNQDGGIVDRHLGVHISNVALVDPTAKKATRVGRRKDGDRTVRFAKKSGATLD